MTAEAIKVRVCEFRKAQPSGELSYIARNLFDEFKRAKFRDRHPRKLPEVRAVGLYLTMATDRELELLCRLTGKARGSSAIRQEQPLLQDRKNGPEGSNVKLDALSLRPNEVS